MDTPCYCALLRATTRRVGALYDEALAPTGVNIAQFSLLSMIDRAAPVSLTQLGGLAELDRSTVGRNVRVLQRMGLVQTGRDGGDQREAEVTLTPTGASAFKAAAGLWNDCQRKIEGRLGIEQAQALRHVLQSL